MPPAARSKHNSLWTKRGVLEIQPHEVFAGKSTDRSNNVASGTSSILEFDDGLEISSSATAIFSRSMSDTRRPACDHMARAFENSGSRWISCASRSSNWRPWRSKDEVKAGDVFRAAFWVGFMDAKEKCTAFPSKHHARQRDGWTLYQRATAI